MSRIIAALFLLVALLHAATAAVKVSPSVKNEILPSTQDKQMTDDDDTDPHKIPKTVSYKLTYVSNQPVEVYIGGMRYTSMYVAPQMKTVELKDVPCKDLFFRHKQTSEKSVAAAAIIEYDGKKYATRQVIKVEKPGEKPSWDGNNNPALFNYIDMFDPSAPYTIPLYATASGLMDADKVFAVAEYNTSTWIPSVLIHSVIDFPVLPFTQIEKMGADPLGWHDGKLPGGTYGLRVLPPFCYENSPTLSM